MMRRRWQWIAAAAAAVTAATASADIYKCTDANGHVTYSNVSSKGCTRLVSSASSDNAAASGKAARPAASPSPASFPRVDGGTQRTRDDDRRRILDSELQAEQKALDAARKELADAEAVPLPEERNVTQRCTPVPGGQACSAVPTGINRAKVDERVAPLRDKVALHERNLEALKKEIANLK